MTTNIDDLNARLAAQLFGLHVRVVTGANGGLGEFTRSREWAWDGDVVFDEDGMPEFVPDYRGTGDGMLAVIEAMRARGYLLLVRYKRQTSVEFIPIDPPVVPEGYLFDASHPLHNGKADTPGMPLPEAVALAADAALTAALAAEAQP